MFNIVKYMSVLVLVSLLGCSSKDVNLNQTESKIDLLSDNWQGRAIAYSGYRNGQDPREKIFPSPKEVLEDLQIIEKNWKVIRTYGSDKHTLDILTTIQKENIKLKVLLGMWLDAEPQYTEENKKQVAYGIELANRFKDIVIAINVGNESQVYWSDHKVPQRTIISYINDVKQKTDVPVTTADTWDFWSDTSKSQPIVDAVDFIATHIYPIWGGVDIDRGLEATIENYNSVKNAIPNKKIVITEAGWATFTKGKQHAPGAGSESKQKIYYDQLMRWSKENKIKVFWFEAFDESWKGDGTEGFWGLFTEKRNPKLVMKKIFADSE